MGFETDLNQTLLWIKMAVKGNCRTFCENLPYLILRRRIQRLMYRYCHTWADMASTSSILFHFSMNAENRINRRRVLTIKCKYYCAQQPCHQCARRHELLVGLACLQGQKDTHYIVASVLCHRRVRYRGFGGSYASIFVPNCTITLGTTTWILRRENFIS
jgi:hypothetical protein